MNVVEGLHYIFDRYAFLNHIMEDNNRSVRITPDSPKERVRKAISLALALYHPDRQENAAKDMKEKAEQTSHMLGDCKRFLLNDDIRPLYNERLQKFKDEKPEFVSVHGNPIVDLHAEMFDVDSLIGEEVPDLQHLEDHARKLVAFDEKQYAQMQILFDTMPENPQVKSLYKEALTNKYIYLDVLEGIAWQKLGYANRKDKAEGFVVYADDYVAQVNKALENVRDNEIKATLEARHGVARIGLSPMPLLLTYNKAAAGTENAAMDYAVMDPADQAQALEKLTQTARSHFDERTKFVQDIAQQKQEVLSRLVALTPVSSLSVKDTNDPIHHFYLIDPDDEDTIIMWAVLDKSTMSAQPQAWNGEKSLKKVIAPGIKANSYAITRNKELVGDVFLMELMSAANRICSEEIAAEAQKSAPATPAAPPKPAP